MSGKGTNRKRKTETSYIFRGKSSKKEKTISMILLEAILMLGLGISLIIFLNNLPGEFVLGVLPIDIWSDISQSFLQLLGSFGQIGLAFLLLLLAVFSLILVVGGSIRVIKVLFSLLKKSYQSRDRNYN